jgi:tetratricopeptide (TPR) repeat protein
LEIAENEEGCERLVESKNILIEALSEIAQTHDPHLWAKIQLNLGRVFMLIGERTNDEELLQRSIKAFEDALVEWPRGEHPLDWARTQDLLGVAYQKISKTENPIMVRSIKFDGFQRAAVAHGNALEELRREKAPMEWAAAQHNLGVALKILGALSENPERIQLAIDAFEEALEVRTKDVFLGEWAITTGMLGTALGGLGNLKKDSVSMERGLEKLGASISALDLSGNRNVEVDLLPDMPSFISRVCSGFGPCWGGLQTRLV